MKEGIKMFGLQWQQFSYISFYQKRHCISKV